MAVDLRRMVGPCGAVLFLCAGAASAQTPAYITAKPDSVARAFGNDVARKIFSNAYTPARQQAVLRSQKTIPGFDCPADPQIALAEVIPFPVKQGTPSWIERYVVGCTPRTMRNFLLVLEGEQPRVIELLPGTPTPIRCCNATRSRAATRRSAPLRRRTATRPIVDRHPADIQDRARRAVDGALGIRPVRHQGGSRNDVHAVRQQRDELDRHTGEVARRGRVRRAGSAVRRV